MREKHKLANRDWMRSIKLCTINSQICLLYTQAIKVKEKKTLQPPRGKYRLYGKEMKTIRRNNSVCKRCFAQKGLNALSSFGEKWVHQKWSLVKICLVQHDIFLWNILPRSYFGKVGAFPGSLAVNRGQFPRALPWIAAHLVPCTNLKDKTNMKYQLRGTQLLNVWFLSLTSGD